jgi:two-component system nitrogen regulation response regulator GlnG
VIYRSAVIAQGDAILVKDLPAEIRSAVEPAGEVAAESAPAVPTAEVSTPATPSASLDAAFDALFQSAKSGGEALLPRLERELATRALAVTDGDEAKAAKLLGITVAALQKLR